MDVMEIDSELIGYLQPRKKPNEAEIRLFLREVDYHCPLCGCELQSRKQKKLSEKNFKLLIFIQIVLQNLKQKR